MPDEPHGTHVLTLPARSFGVVLDDPLDLAGQPCDGSGAAPGPG